MCVRVRTLSRIIAGSGMLPNNSFEIVCRGSENKGDRMGSNDLGVLISGILSSRRALQTVHVSNYERGHERINKLVAWI